MNVQLIGPDGEHPVLKNGDTIRFKIVVLGVGEEETILPDGVLEGGEEYVEVEIQRGQSWK